MQFIKSHPVMTGVCIFNLILIIVIIVLFVNKTAQTATLDILVTPADATISVDGTVYENGTYKVHPGSTTATISKDGFETKTIILTPESDHVTKLHQYLTGPGDDFGYYITHSADTNILRQVKDTAADEFLVKYDHANSIRDALPIADTKYSSAGEIISSIKISLAPTVNCPTYVCLSAAIISASDNDVRALITTKGYNPSDYNIEYKHY